jgi:hypothetical protein
VQEIFFNTETENYQISHTDLISGKTPHTLFPAVYFLSAVMSILVAELAGPA